MGNKQYAGAISMESRQGIESKESLDEPAGHKTPRKLIHFSTWTGSLLSPKDAPLRRVGPIQRVALHIEGYPVFALDMCENTQRLRRIYFTGQ